MSNIEQIVDFALEDDPISVMDATNEAMFEKVAALMQARKMEISKNLFNMFNKEE
jgi:hypothetical protein